MNRFSAHRIVLAYTLIVTVGLVALVYLQQQQAGEITKIRRQVERVERTVDPTRANACAIFARIGRKPKPCRSDETPDPFIARVQGGGGVEQGGPPPGLPGGGTPPSATEAIDETVDDTTDAVDEAVDGATDTACDLAQNPDPLC